MLNFNDGTSNNLYRWLIVGFLFPLIFLNGWLALRFFEYFQPLVTIFVLATLLAFILNYPVHTLQQRGVKRGNAVLLVSLLTLVILLTLGVTLVPLLLEQLSEVPKVLPQWLDSSNQKLQVLHDWAVSHKLPISLNRLVLRLTDRLPEELQSVGDQLVTLALDAIGSVTEILLTLVFSFYLLLDGERLWSEIFQKLPVELGFRIQQSLYENFRNYFVGQVALGALVGLAMTTMFLLLRVQFGLLLGLGVGVMTLIPFGDVLGFGVVSLLVASQDLWLGVKVLLLAVLIDQVIDQAIAPRLLGSFTGLRPIWILVALLVGTKVAGLVGLLTAVPLAGFIKSATDGFQPPSVSSSSNVDGLAAPPASTNSHSESDGVTQESSTLPKEVPPSTNVT